MKNTPLPTLCAALAVLALLASPQPGYAVTLSPLTLVMERDKTIVTLHVQNDDKEPRIFEVQAFRWSQEGGEDRLAPAIDLVVTPPIVKLAPGEEKIIRVGVMKKDRESNGEKAYRLLLRDITPTELQAGELHLQMQYLLPLFVSPVRPHGGVQLVEAASSDDTRCIKITNTGNVHAKLVWTAGDGAPESVSPTQKYVLAGGQTLYCPKVASAEMGAARVGVTSAYQSEVTSYEVMPPAH
ncbi:MAG: fimbria/pilus periplasmic chaperone [Hyphomonadaceae bacterium]